MKLYRLTNDQADQFAKLPESAMGLQFAEGDNKLVVCIVGGQVILDARTADPEEGLLEQPWLSRSGLTQQSRETAFDAWLAALPDWKESLNPLDANRTWTGGTQPPAGPAPAPPPPGKPVPGHLPYQVTTNAGEVFYRWEAWPKSVRIDQKTGTVSRGTFTAPFSEAPFVPTGFAAVGRFALPNVAPAIFRWEMRPPAGTVFRCGASVPLFGQSGGGVEAEFTGGFANVGPIANPVVLPAL
jgi:hypothetical protein